MQFSNWCSDTSVKVTKSVRQLVVTETLIGIEMQSSAVLQVQSVPLFQGDRGYNSIMLGSFR